MPIRINLMAEAIADEDLRRRDPVKRAIYAGAFLVALSLVWFSSTFLEYMMDKQRLDHLEIAISMHSNDWAVVQSNFKKINEVQHRLDSLDQLTTARFLQATMLNGLQQTYVPNVQLTRMHIDQSYSSSPGVPARTNSFGVLPAHGASIAEHVTLTVDAKDSSASPGDQVNVYKDTILKQNYFHSVMDATNSIRLLGESPIQSPADGKPYVMFTLECRFLDRYP